MARLSTSQRTALLAAGHNRLWYSQYTGGYGARYWISETGVSGTGTTVPRSTIRVLVREGLIEDVKPRDRMAGGFTRLILVTEKGRLA